MKTIILMRHADADFPDIAEVEQERSISVAGLWRVEKIKAIAADVFNGIDLVLCSHLKRARQTLQELALADLGEDRVIFDHTLSQISQTALLDKIKWLPAHCSKVLIISHKPVLSQFLKVIGNYNTKLQEVVNCELLVLEAKVEAWHDVSYQTLKLKKRIVPNIADDSL
ncbi:MAG: hypothetical protein LBF72_01810 [Holosporales bacterium]|jgi:phosphohistidine phosphatase SixA|nr:hypothetical protein [Holosporales bacterium]